MQTTISSQHIGVDLKTLEAVLGQEATALALAQSAAQSLRALLGLKLAPLGLALGQDRVLFALEPKQRMTISEIAEAVNVRPSTVSKMMDRLEDRGLAKRLPSETDARLTHAELTDEGRAVCKKLRVLCAAIDDELQSDLSEDEAKRMVESLTLLDTVLAKRLKRLR